MRSYKIFHVGDGPGQINVGVEFILDEVTIDRHNLTFSADRTPEEIRSEIESQLNAKIAGIDAARTLATALLADVNVERQVIPIGLSFNPPAGNITFPITITIIPSEAIPDTMEIHYTIDGTDPGELSAPYRVPFSLTSPGTVKAAIFSLSMDVRSPVFAANYSVLAMSGPMPITKSALLAAIPQADLSLALANDVAYRVFNSFLIQGPDPVVTTQEAASRVKSFVDQFKAGAILSQVGYDAVRDLMVGKGWIWA